jgi:hypothetical protein
VTGPDSMVLATLLRSKIASWAAGARRLPGTARVVYYQGYFWWYRRSRQPEMSV